MYMTDNIHVGKPIQNVGNLKHLKIVGHTL